MRRWSERRDLRETSAEAAFIEEFFCKTWGYEQTGQPGSEGGRFTLWPKFKIEGAGARGGTGEADLAIGVFSKTTQTQIPQIICEFKDVKSKLDAPQRRKGDNRSPVRQCLDYLFHARRHLFTSDPILPTWGIVTDMNEFRLYWHDRGHHQFYRFLIASDDLLLRPHTLVADTESTLFDRFLFLKLFHRSTLLSEAGRSLLHGLITKQRFKDRQLEKTFYSEYRRFRERLYEALLQRNPEGTDRFPGTRSRLVRLAQRILDRCLFIFFCEDMGLSLAYPPKLLQDLLVDRSTDTYFDAEGINIWQDILHLFRVMDGGGAFGGKRVNQFNGGLFIEDPALERLHIPNHVFCQHMQGASEENLYLYKETLLYLCASYDYAADLRSNLGSWAAAKDSTTSLGLYVLGRVFEQSITELEILEARADGRPSVNNESKRKRDGVYYTPEWVVEKIVEETIGSRLSEIKRECGWPRAGDPTLEEIDAYSTRLKSFTILDPACGSGAFLITALRYLVGAWHEVQGLRRQVSKGLADRDDDDDIIAEILKWNIYGVDINAASVEIARLALWLHTARDNSPLSSLEENIREGNSLIGPEFYRGQIELEYNDVEKERVNAFDWQEAFSNVFDRGGFDAIVGNPPYVKLQNFRTAHADMATFLREGRGGMVPYRSTQTGNFDLYLPFIERGIGLLNDGGCLGYIAPSLWITNEYGEGLRTLVAKGRNLSRWIDFKSYQVFEESTTYTALQFFTKKPNDAILVANAPTGEIPDDPWSGPGCGLPYGRQTFEERWLLLTGEERSLMDRLYRRCNGLDDEQHTKQIFQGLITSADSIYHLKRLGAGRYVCTPKGGDRRPYEVEIEDALMKPLVSGAEAKRYVVPKTDTYVLFPYRLTDKGVELIDSAAMQQGYPQAWRYLKANEKTLRFREAKFGRDGSIISAPFDDHQWYRFGRHQNLDKQERCKLIVAQTVPSMRVCYDDGHHLYLNNVRVNGIIQAEREDPWFLLGVLNSNVCDFVFQRLAKVKAGGYYEANKQFIAPLSIPPASAEELETVAGRARALQAAHTKRRDVLDNTARRLSTLRSRNMPLTWLFPQLRTERDLVAHAPERLTLGDKQQWAKKQFDLALNAIYESINARLYP